MATIFLVVKVLLGVGLSLAVWSFVAAMLRIDNLTASMILDYAVGFCAGATVVLLATKTHAGSTIRKFSGR